ncbi:MAG: hypothetical protein CVU03_14085 [Bacteroidetes bacterium HGW-Bacteroidetes-2]|jgi:hypothetical protein|nr:MAG: hypothetical protein CVU03_14085 [Bacteroidetes bacterium HGW-Bacteroidetes-2]
MKRTFNLIVSALLLIIIISCSPIKYTYGSKDNFEKISLALKKGGYIDEKKYFIVFNNGFNNDYVSIKIGENIIFENNINSEKKVITQSFKISYDSVCKILFNNKIELVIYPKDVEEYKFVYLSKENKNIIVDFNNMKKIN